MYALTGHANEIDLVTIDSSTELASHGNQCVCICVYTYYRIYILF